jgi:hypothetical protein
MTSKPKGRGLLGAAGVGLRRQIEQPAIDHERASQPSPRTDTPTSDARSAAMSAMDQDLAARTFPEEEVQAQRTNQRGAHRNASRAIVSGEVTMRTVYLTSADRDRLDDAVAALKKTRRLRGQIGLSLAVRIGAKLLEERLDHDPDTVVAIARELTLPALRRQ